MPINVTHVVLQVEGKKGMDKLCDIIAERAVLSGLYQYGEDAYIDIVDLLQPDTFTDDTNQIVYKALIYLYEEKDIKKYDQSSLLSAINELGFSDILSRVSDVNHVKSIINSKVRLDNIRKWAGQIRKLQIARLLKDQLSQACVSIDDIKGSEPIDQILGIAETAIFDFTSLLQTQDNNEPKLLGDFVDEYLKNIEDNPTAIIGISSGMPYYDQAIGGGFRRKTVSMIGARTKVGKSQVGMNIGKHVSTKLAVPILYLDTEMTAEDQLSRIIPSLMADHCNLRVTINELEKGEYVDSELKTKGVHNAADILKKSLFHYLNVSGKGIEEVLSIIRRWITKHVGFDENGRRKDCLVIYDYLKLMGGENINESLKEYQILGFQATSLHNFAVRHDIPILCFTQLNRDGIDKESTAAMSGSDRILWLVTNFSIYKPKDDVEIAEDGADAGNRKLVPIMARHGEGLEYGDYINVIFEGRFGRIKEGELKSILKKKKGNQGNSPTNSPSKTFEVNIDKKDEIPFGDIHPTE